MNTASHLAILVLATFNLSAATLYVALDCTNPVAPFTTWATAATNIQDAVDASHDGDTVLVTNGVYAVGGREVSVFLEWLQDWWGIGQSRVVVTNSIRLESVNGPLVTTITGGTEPGDFGGTRCVYLGSNAVLSGFTLTNGASWNGGAGVFSGPSGVVTNCTLTGNHANISSLGGFGVGGGAYGGTLYNCRLSGNSARPGGGGGACWSTLYNCTLTENGGGYCGGGAYGCTLYNCTLAGNSGCQECGGNGECFGEGGGASDSALYNCTLTGNSAWERGGGASRSTLYNCTLTRNSARFHGGADGSTLYNCTVTGNSAEGSGGGVSGCTTFNSIVYYNSGGNYGEGTVLNFSCTTPLPTNGVGNITGPPLFMDMGAGDFRLREESLCIDAGTNLLGSSIMGFDAAGDWVPVGHITDSTDILGNTRFIDGNFDGKVAWDIGAYEFNSFRPPRFSVQPQLTADGWNLNVTGAPNKWVHLQRSGNLKDWEDVRTPVYMGDAGVGRITDGDPQGAMFYRAAVP